VSGKIGKVKIAGLENTGMEISTRHCREGVENEGVEFPGGYGCHVCV